MNDFSQQPQAQKQPEIKPPPEPFRFTLSNPVKAHGEEVSELVFREPTATDLVAYGSPWLMSLAINETAMEKMMSALANVPPSTIKQLTAREWNAIAWELVARFFIRGKQRSDARLLQAGEVLLPPSQ